MEPNEIIGSTSKKRRWTAFEKLSNCSRDLPKWSYKRKANNILRTLRTMEQYGLVILKENPNKKHRGRAPLMPKALI